MLCAHFSCFIVFLKCTLLHWGKKLGQLFLCLICVKRLYNRKYAENFYFKTAISTYIRWEFLEDLKNLIKNAVKMKFDHN